MKGDQKKVVSNDQKPTQTPSKHQREGYQSLFQPTNVGRDPPQGPLTHPLAPKMTRIAVHSMVKRWPGRGRCVKIQQKPTKHHPNIKTTTTKQFPTKKIHPGPSRRSLAQFREISDFGNFRVWKSYFQNFPDFFWNRWTSRTRLKVVRTSNESI